MMASLLYGLGVIFLLLVVIILIYNRLVALREQCKNAFSQIDIQLKRRYDLIPNLVEVAKKYMSHERESLEAVIAARNQAVRATNLASERLDAGQLASLNQADQALSAGLGRLLAVSEAYPDLKADAQMIELSREIESTESRIAFAKQAFNDCVMEYNTKLGSVPSNIIGGAFGFTEMQLFVAIEDKKEREAVRVSF